MKVHIFITRRVPGPGRSGTRWDAPYLHLDRAAPPQPEVLLRYLSRLTRHPETVRVHVVDMAHGASRTLYLLDRFAE